MNPIINVVEQMKEEGINVNVIVGPRGKREKKTILESIRKIKDSGDKDKLEYVNNLYRYYSIFLNLQRLVNSHEILEEKEVKYHCKTFLNFLNDTIVDTSKRVITGIIYAVANDEPLDSFFKYLMRPDIYEEEYRRDKVDKYQVKSDEEEEEEEEDDYQECCRSHFYNSENQNQNETRKKIHHYLEKLEKNGDDYKIRNIKKLYRIYNFFYEIKSLIYDKDTFVYTDKSYSVNDFYLFLDRVVDLTKSDIIKFIDMLQEDDFNNKKILTRHLKKYQKKFYMYLNQKEHYKYLN